MQLLSDVKQKVGEFAQENATVLLTAGGVVGTVGTAVLAWRGGYKYSEVLAERSAELMDQEGTEFEKVYEDDNLTINQPIIPFKDKVFLIAPHIAPPIITGAATVTAIVFSHRMSAQKAAALAAAYGLAERNFSDYKAKVEEKLTGPKAQAVKDEVAQDAVDRTPGHDKVVVIEGEVLCFDVNAGRYFNSTVERIRQAANTTNAEVISRGYAPVSFFYDELDLEGAPWADAVGFGPDNLLELDISTQLKAGRPCVTINFVKPPQTEYGDPKNY